jgi:Meiotically up-regulated gene 113
MTGGVMTRADFGSLCEQLALQPDFVEAQAALECCSAAARYAVTRLLAEFEWKGGWLTSRLSGKTAMRKYRNALMKMPETLALVEDVAWRLIQTAYWQAYYRVYQRVIPTREAFHARYFREALSRTRPSPATPPRAARVPTPPRAPKPPRVPKPPKVRIPITGEVYLILAETTDLVKIGHGKTAVDRLRALATGSPFPLRLLRAIPASDSFRLEQALHARYDAYCVHNEWFRLPSEVLAQLLEESFL